MADVIPFPRNSLHLIRVSRFHILYHAVDAFVDSANEVLLSLRNQWHLFLEYRIVDWPFRDRLVGVMGLLSALTQICLNLRELADTVKEAAKSAKCSAEAFKIYNLSYSYLPTSSRTVIIYPTSKD